MAETPGKKRKSVAVVALLLSIFGTGCAFLGPGGVIAGLVLGILAFVLQWKAPDRYAGGGTAVAAILFGAGGLWFWRTAGPHISSRGELRYRAAVTGAGEAQAIGALRELASVEDGYARANGGAYGELACLTEPGKCVRDYPADAPVLTGAWPGFTKAGAYVVTFHAGPRAGATGLKSFAGLAVPRVHGETGRRAFCVDSSFVMRVSQDGKAPALENGLCATSTPELR